MKYFKMSNEKKNENIPGIVMTIVFAIIMCIDLCRSNVSMQCIIVYLSFVFTDHIIQRKKKNIFGIILSVVTIVIACLVYVFDIFDK